MAGACLAGAVLLLLAAGCAGVTNAESATSLVRIRPTTPPATYDLQLTGTVSALSESLDKLSALLADPRYFDDTWKSTAVNLATLVELGYRQLEALAPPDEQQEQHAEAVQAVRDCQTLTVYVFQGISNLDKGPFDEVKERVDFCRSKLDLATRAPGSVESRSQPVSVEAARQAVQVRVKRDANLRGGPGTAHPRVATAAAGDTFTAVGRTAQGDWLQVSSERVKNAWIAAFLVQADGDLRTVAVVDATAPSATSTNQGNP